MAGHNNSHAYGQQQQQQGDGFDGVYAAADEQGAGGFFGLADHSSGHNQGVELEVMSNVSANTRSEQMRDRLDHRTGSDISSQAGAQADRPLISGEPLLQGVSEVPMAVPAAAAADDGKRLRRRQRRDGEQDEEAGGYASYEPPNRSRSLARAEKADGAVRQRAISRGTGSRRPRVSASAPRNRQRKQAAATAAGKRRCCASPWLAYCRVVTFWAPGRVLKCFGMAEPKVQLAWREKMGLVSIILFIMGVIAFVTFGLQQVLCGLSGQQTRVKWNEVGNGYAVVNGRAYDITKYKHPVATPWSGAAGTNLMGEPANAGGKDLSFLFQNPNGACRGVLTYDASATDSRGNVVNVFPCVYYNNTEAINPNQISGNQGCHNTAKARKALGGLTNSPVSYTWADVKSNGNLVVFKGAVLDLQRAQFLLDTVKMPADMADLAGGKMRGMDVSLYLSSGRKKDIGNCMMDIFSVGSIDSSSMGCIAANIVLYVSLIVILGTVLAKFFMAIYFGWFMGPRLGQVKQFTPEDRRNRQAEIEAWADDNNHYGKEKLDRKYTVLGHGAYDSVSRANNRKSRFFPTTSRYSHFMPGDEPGARDKARPAARPRPASAMPRQSAFFSDHARQSGGLEGARQSALFPDHRASHYSASQVLAPEEPSAGIDVQALAPPAPAVSPWNFDLAYTLLLVTCYSEGSHGIRTTLDSLCGTDYPASHKCLFIICDGLIKGAGED
ncbi:Chitin synthase, class 3, partial [Coemansia sp. RSA 2618]